MKNDRTQLPDKLLNELLELAAGVCNEEISDAGSKRLAEILDGNVAAQQAYGQYMLIHAELYWLEDSMAGSSAAPPVSSLPTNDGTRRALMSWSWPLSLAALLLIGLGDRNLLLGLVPQCSCRDRSRLKCARVKGRSRPRDRIVELPLARPTGSGHHRIRIDALCRTASEPG